MLSVAALTLQQSSLYMRCMPSVAYLTLYSMSAYVLCAVVAYLMPHILCMPSVADLTLHAACLNMLQHAFSSRLDAACSMYVYILCGEVDDLTLQHAEQCVCKHVW